MLKRFIRKATAAASPVKASGVAATTVSLSAPCAMNAASNDAVERMDRSGGRSATGRRRIARTRPRSRRPERQLSATRADCRRRSIRITRAPDRPPSAGRAPRRWPTPRRARPTTAPSYITAMRSARARISSRSSLMSNTPTPVEAASRRYAWTVSMLDDVEPARRRGGDEHCGLAGELAGEHDLLQVPAGELPGGHVAPGRRARRSCRSAPSASSRMRRNAKNGPRETGERRYDLSTTFDCDAQTRRDSGAEAVLGTYATPAEIALAWVAVAQRDAR